MRHFYLAHDRSHYYVLNERYRKVLTASRSQFETELSFLSWAILHLNKVYKAYGIRC